MKVKYTGNGSISTTYDGETYSFDVKNRVQDIPPHVYDFIKQSKHVEATYILPVVEEGVDALIKENEKLKKENAALKAENETLKKKSRGRRKKTL